MKENKKVNQRGCRRAILLPFANINQLKQNNMENQNTNNQLFTSISELENLLKQMKENKLGNTNMSDYVTIDLDFDRHLERFRTGISGVQHSHSGNNEEVIFL